MHPRCGILQHIRAFSTPEQNPVFKVLSTPAHPQVTQTVKLPAYRHLPLQIEFGHSLTNLLGDQMDAGLVITDMYEDYMSDSPLKNYHPSYIATRAMKM